VELLSSFKSMDNERESLRRFVQAEARKEQSSGHSADTAPLLLGLKRKHKIEGDVLTWLDDASLPELRSALPFVVQTVPIGSATSLECIRRSGKPVVRARWSVSALHEALRWMVWYDEYTQNPLVCCQACRKTFRPETAHARKYCSYECAHRVAAREWQRNQRKLRRS
jgi:hypothetical protein